MTALAPPTEGATDDEAEDDTRARVGSAALAPPRLSDDRGPAITRGGPPRGLSHRLPRWLRVVLMGVLFFFFFTGCPVIALVLLPILRLVSKDYRARGTYLLNRGLTLVITVGRFIGTVDFELPTLPASVDPKKPFVMISNHPTYVDMLLLLGSFPEMTCVTSGRWSRHWALGRLLRSTNYLPGPGSGLKESEDMLSSMVAHLRAGHSLLIFPEGKRSHADTLRRFRRGAVEAATAANVPIVPLFVGIDQPYLTKDVPLWRPPSPPPTYTFEWFDVIEPAAFDGNAKRIQRHVEERYKARFAEQLTRQQLARQESARLPAPGAGGAGSAQKS